MSASPLVSVIMPCRNAGRMLRPALRSVIEQTHPAVEIIFVDDGSTDGSLELAREVLVASGRPYEVTSSQARGANNARNHGYRFAHGAFIQWIDSDDAMDRNKIALQVAAMADRNIDIAYGDWSSHRQEPGLPDKVERFGLRQVDDQALRTLGGVWYPPHLYLLRRDAADLLQAEQAWWPERVVATDAEYSAIAALLGLRFRHVPGAHVRYNIWSETQIGKRISRATRAANLRAIFERLRGLVEQGRARVPIGRRHRVLLDQSWDFVFLNKEFDPVRPTTGPARRVA